MRIYRKKEELQEMDQVKPGARRAKEGGTTHQEEENLAKVPKNK